MSTNKFIPQIWSAKILEALDKELVYAKLFNTDYEGEITEAGDTVHIAQIGDVDIKAYTAGANIDDPDEVTATDQLLVIDTARYFNIAVDDVDAAQSKINLLDAATQRAGFGFADAADADLGNTLANEGTVVPGLGTDTEPLAVTKDNAYEVIVKLGAALNKVNLPKQERKVVVPPDFEAYMLLDPRFVAVGTDASEERLTSGTIYKAAGFEILVSNNVPSGTNPGSTFYTVVASSPVQGTFAQQILKTEAYRPQSRFSDAVKGLHVYGAKVLRPEAVVKAYVSF